MKSFADEDLCLMHLVRHGATEHNLLSPPRLQGCSIDQPLAERGRDQMQRAAQALAGRQVVAVYASPLLRAAESAALVAAPHGLQVRTVEQIGEVRMGRWEDRSWEDITVNDAQACAAFRRDPVTHGYPGGENLGEVLARGQSTFESLMREHVGSEIVVVAHSVVNRVYLGELLQLPIHLRHKVPQTNGGISLVAWRGGRAKAVTVNAVGHL